ncbi:MAG: hypothetical protein KGR47_15080, partial [Acidobacteria bacterium]|nr:hypothetical protein [Acidobacteriota bacterium]
IIPVGIGGSERAMPKGAKFIRPVKLHVIIGPPIVVPPSDSPKAARDASRQMTVQLHAELQRLFDLAQARAGH